MAGREPERTCVGCRGTSPKRALLRVVRQRDGLIRPDPSGCAPGRGAYVHRDGACVSVAIRRGALARALRTSLDPGEAASLQADIERIAGI